MQGTLLLLHSLQVVYQTVLLEIRSNWESECPIEAKA